MKLSKEDVDRLWSSYKLDADMHTRNNLLVAYMPLVKNVAKRLGFTLPPSVEDDDLISYGVFGLIDAIDKFDPSRGFKFETYAISRIRGSILDELRAMDWVPRSVRAKARAIDGVQGSSAFGRHLSDREVASELGMSNAQFDQAQTDLTMASVLHLDTPVSNNDQGDQFELADVIPDHGQGPQGVYEIDDVRGSIVKAVNLLPERERMVVALYYYDGLTLAEIGHILGVTESRVCQIHTKACRAMSSAANWR